jgi:hypothetical protein
MTHCGLEALRQEGRRQPQSQKAASAYYRAMPGTATAPGLTRGHEFAARAGYPPMISSCTSTLPRVAWE